MQVGAGRAAALPDQRDAVAGAHRLPLGDQQQRVVRVDGQQVARVFEHDHVAVAANPVARVGDLAVGGREHRRADGRRQVDPLVRPAVAGPERGAR